MFKGPLPLISIFTKRSKLKLKQINRRGRKVERLNTTIPNYGHREPNSTRVAPVDEAFHQADR